MAELGSGPWQPASVAHGWSGSDQIQFCWFWGCSVWITEPAFWFGLRFGQEWFCNCGTGCNWLNLAMPPLCSPSFIVLSLSLSLHAWYSTTGCLPIRPGPNKCHLLFAPPPKFWDSWERSYRCMLASSKSQGEHTFSFWVLIYLLAFPFLPTFTHIHLCFYSEVSIFYTYLHHLLLNNGCCTWSLHHGPSRRFSDPQYAWLKDGFPSSTGTAYGEPKQ